MAQGITGVFCQLRSMFEEFGVLSQLKVRPGVNSHLFSQFLLGVPFEWIVFVQRIGEDIWYMSGLPRPAAL